MGEQARGRVEYFAWRHIAENYVTVYNPTEETKAQTKKEKKPAVKKNTVKKSTSKKNE